MAERTPPDEERLLEQLAALEENPATPVDATVRQLHADLNTLAGQLKSVPPSLGPVEDELACRIAVEQARAVADPSTVRVPVAPSTEPLPEAFEHYRVVRLLGQGGMGAVYLAEDTRLSRLVAVKTLKPELASAAEARERFLREARLAATIEHDHVVPIYYVGEAGGVPFLAMPFLRGQSLEELLKGDRRFTAAQVVRLGLQIAEGLAAAHEKGLVHRDIKPGNLWVDPTAGGRIRILDFGLARPNDADTGLTQSGMILGTPAYMAPEQAKGGKVDCRADLYSLGVVLYRLATGQLPLRGADAMSMLIALATEHPRPIRELVPELPVALAELITQLLNKDPNQRPGSAQETAQALRTVLDSLNAPHAVQALPPTAEPAEPADVDPQTVKKRAASLESIEEHRQATAPVPQPAMSRHKPPRWPLAAVAMASFAAVVLAAVILIIRDRQGKEIARIELPEGSTIEAKNADGIATVSPRTELKPEDRTTESQPQDMKGNSPAADLPLEKDPQRRAVEWVLSISGTVVIRHNGQERAINAVSHLPDGSFEVVYVHLPDNQQVTDDGLVHLKELKGLYGLQLKATRVTDAGLAHLKELKSLTVLNLESTQVTDAGLVQLKGFEDLIDLILTNTQITDAGMVHFKAFKAFRGLSLERTHVTDAGLVHLKDVKGLTGLSLSSTRVTDIGLECLYHLRSLDALVLDNTNVSDRSLSWIAAQPGRKYVFLWNTRISRQGYEQLKAVHPEWVCGWSERNHELAQAVLKLGGEVWIAGRNEAEPKLVKHADELIRDYFQVRRVSVTPTGDVLKLLYPLTDPDWDRLEVLDLSGHAVPDMKYLPGFPTLTELYLANCNLNDPSLEHLPALPKLRKLVLDGNDVRAGGLRHVVDTQPQLEELSLARTALNDLVLSIVAELKEITRLNLSGTPITDRGIRELGKLAKLESINLRQTSVTAAGVNQLKQMIPSCQIIWDEAK